MRDLRLKQKWRGFLKRSAHYKMAIVYAIIGLIFFCFAFYSVSLMAANYRDGIGFYIETAEELRAVGFLTAMSLVSGSFLFLALLMWTCSLFVFLSDQEHRIKRIERFIEQDAWLSKDFERLRDMEKTQE